MSRRARAACAPPAGDLTGSRRAKSLHAGLTAAGIALHMSGLPVPPCARRYTTRVRPGGGVVTQRIANPCTPVRFRSRPPILPPLSPPYTRPLCQASACARKAAHNTAALTKPAARAFDGERACPQAFIHPDGDVHVPPHRAPAARVCLLSYRKKGPRHRRPGSATDADRLADRRALGDFHALLAAPGRVRRRAVCGGPQSSEAAGQKAARRGAEAQRQKIAAPLRFFWTTPRS